MPFPLESDGTNCGLQPGRAAHLEEGLEGVDVWNHPRPPNCETVFCEERAQSGPRRSFPRAGGAAGPLLALGPELPDPSGEQGEPRGAG